MTFNELKKVITLNQKLKLNSDYTIEFLTINPLKEDHTQIYLRKILLMNIYLIKIIHYRTILNIL
jgi:hypothetical protein